MGVNVADSPAEGRSHLDKMPKVSYETGQIYATPRIQWLFQTADAEAKRLKDEFVGTEHFLIAMSRGAEGRSCRHILREAGIDQEKVYNALKDIRGGHRVTDARAESKYRSLEKYSRDLDRTGPSGQARPGYRPGR